MAEKNKKEKPAKRKRNDPKDYVKMYNDGKSLEEISKHFGITKAAVYMGLRVNNVQVASRKVSVMRNLERDQIINALNEAQSVNDAANELGVSYGQLHTAINSHDITMSKLWS